MKRGYSILADGQMPTAILRRGNRPVTWAFSGQGVRIEADMAEVIVVGGGLAGVEAAWQAARAGARVRLHEMRPMKQTAAHRTDKLAEIVCSNSLKSDEPGTAPYLLKEELRRGGSLVMEAATATRVPAGAALAVDRQRFADHITKHIEDN